MTEVSTLVKCFITLTISYCFLTPEVQRVLLPHLITNPFSHLQQWFWQYIQPRIERNLVQVPEAFMSMVQVYYYY